MTDEEQIRRLTARWAQTFDDHDAAAWTALWLVRAKDETPREEFPSPSPSASVIGEAPQRFGSVYLCPLDAMYRAYVSRGYHFYPPNHPLLP